MTVPDPPLPTKALEPATSDAEDTPPDIPRDWRAVVVAVSGFAAVALVVVVGLKMLPGPIESTKTDNASGTIGGAIGAAVAAIGSMVAAYFGIKSATQSAERATQSAQNSVQVATKAAQESAQATAQAAQASAQATAQAAQASAQAAAQTAQDTSTKAQQTNERLQTQNDRLQAANERAVLTLNEVSAAGETQPVQEALDRAIAKIKDLNLDPQ